MTEYEKTVLELFAKAMKMAMKERKIGVNELCEKAGISKTIFYRIMNGESYTIVSLIKIMRILKIHLEFSLMSAENNILTMDGNKLNLN